MAKQKLTEDTPFLRTPDMYQIENDAPITEYSDKLLDLIADTPHGGIPLRQMRLGQPTSPRQNGPGAPKGPCKFTKNNLFCTTIFRGLLFFSQNKSPLRIFS